MLYVICVQEDEREPRACFFCCDESKFLLLKKKKKRLYPALDVDNATFPAYSFKNVVWLNQGAMSSSCVPPHCKRQSQASVHFLHSHPKHIILKNQIQRGTTLIQSYISISSKRHIKTRLVKVEAPEGKMGITFLKPSHRLGAIGFSKTC